MMPTSDTETIRFLLGGKVVCLPLTDTGSLTQTVLGYLRETERRTGTKEGCAEGDCGACTVVVGELCEGKVRLRPVNACIQFLPTLDGKALFTVEDLRGTDGSLHPAQQAMVDCHGSQCGFCTPGFVMSLWSLYQQSLVLADSRPDEAAIRNALSGNLCRCTGYRPIIEAGSRMFDLPQAHFDSESLKQNLLAIQRQTSLTLHHQGQHFFAPRTLEALLSLRAAHPEATILAGSTDIGLWVNKQFRQLGDIIFVGEVAELKTIQQTATTLSIGAAVSLTDAYAALKAPYPEMNELWTRFASLPIRNAGTLGGNVANGSPIGDSMPALIALGASVTLASVAGTRTLPLEDLYLGYMKKAMAGDEVLTAIHIPLPTAQQQFRTYKVSKRFDSDISAVCAAFALQWDEGKITHCRIAFGGMAATPKRATRTEAALLGKPWDEATARAAMTMLGEDYAPLTDLRASREYRMKTAQNLLYRFFLETRPTEPLPVEALRVFV